MGEKEAVMEKKPMLTSRQVGLIAAFGGAAFACRAMGIVIPLVPPFVVGPALLFIAIAAAAGGPIVGALTGVLRAIPCGIPLACLAGDPVMGIVYGLLHEYVVRRPKNRLAQIVLIWITLQITNWCNHFAVAFVGSLIGLFPFYPTYPWVMMPALQSNFLIQAIVLSILAAISPTFLRLKTK